MLPPGDSHGRSDSQTFTLSERASDILSRHPRLNLTDKIEFVDYGIRGCGGFSDVYYGRLTTSSKYVAIKRLRVQMECEFKLSKVCDALTHLPGVCSHIAQNIVRELRVWASLSHPNILPLLGYIFSQSTGFAFVSEWMENGTAHDFLEKCPDTDHFGMV
jgi:serine/threonine protein kinase